MAKFKVLRTGISQRVGDKWVSPKVGALIELSDAAAQHLLTEKFVEEVKTTSFEAPKKEESE